MFELFISIFSSGEANLARFVFFSQRVEIPVTGPRFLSKVLVITHHPLCNLGSQTDLIGVVIVEST